MKEHPVTPLEKLLRALWDTMLLNFLWIATSIPVITIGASSSAVYSVLLRRESEGELPVVSNYFKSFASGVWQATLLFLLAAVMGVIAWVNIQFGMTFTGAMRVLYIVIGGLFALCCLIVLLIAIPLQAGFKNTFAGYLKNAAALAVSFPGKFLLLVCIWAIPIGLALMLPLRVVIIFGIMYLLWGFSMPAFFSSKILTDIFETLQPKEDEVIEEPSEEPEE